MADKHPYIPTSGYVVQALAQFRKSFPATVNAETLKKLGFAPKNESYVLNLLRFLGLIDQEGKKTADASKVFSQHDDTAFSQEFGKLVQRSYKDLFDLHGDDSWSLASNALITFFRSADQSTALVGKLQASTFQKLAGFAGHGEIPASNPPNKKLLSGAKAKSQTKAPLKTPKVQPPGFDTNLAKRSNNLGLTVRIEINLPAGGDQETYDRIFKSIRDNLLNE